jgi:hypothetical protein
MASSPPAKDSHVATQLSTRPGASFVKALRWGAYLVAHTLIAVFS